MLESSSTAAGQDRELGKSKLFSSIRLRCGRVISNRLVKVAMYEHLADLFGGPPNSDHFDLYSRWAKHNWGMIITGNVQVSARHLTLGRDIVLPQVIAESTIQPFRRLAEVIHSTDRDQSPNEKLTPPLAIMQLSHAGRQSPNLLGGRVPFRPPLAPSAIAVGRGKEGEGFLAKLFNNFLFQTPQEMSDADVDECIEAFARGAKLAVLAGFDGVQLHAAHGYLIAQFISPKTNKRSDSYSYKSNALAFLYRAATAIRQVSPVDFVVGIKINASDYVDSVKHASNKPESDLAGIMKEEQELKALEHVRQIASWECVDFIEISGGDYEAPEFMSTSALLKSPRQAFFARFSSRAKEAIYAARVSSPGETVLPLILLTGGLRTPSHLYTALRSEHADLLGIGRGSVVCPNLPDLLRQNEYDSLPVYTTSQTTFAPEPNLSVKPFGFDSCVTKWLWTFVPKIQLIGAGAGMAWYVVNIRNVARSPSDGRIIVDHGMGPLSAIVKMWMSDSTAATLAAALALLPVVITAIICANIMQVS